MQSHAHMINDPRVAALHTSVFYALSMSWVIAAFVWPSDYSTWQVGYSAQTQRVFLWAPFSFNRYNLYTVATMMLVIVSAPVRSLQLRPSDIAPSLKHVAIMPYGKTRNTKHVRMFICHSIAFNTRAQHSAPTSVALANSKANL